MLRIENQATAKLQQLYLGYGQKTGGLLEVNGVGTELTNLGSVWVGYSGHGEARIQNGGHWKVGESTAIHLNVVADGNVNSNDPDNHSGKLVIDGGTVAVGGDLRIGNADQDAIFADFDVSLYTGITNPLVTVGRDLQIRRGVRFHLNLDEDFTSTIGETFTIIRVDGTGPLPSSGYFVLPSDTATEIEEGDFLTAYGKNNVLYEFQVSYEGGAGNDFTLTTVIPEPGVVALLAPALLALGLRRRRMR